MASISDPTSASGAAAKPEADRASALDPIDPRLAAHASALRTAAGGFCRGSSELDDLVQDTFERALRHFAAGNPPPAHMRAWLISIMRNVFIDRVRRTKTFVPITDHEVPVVAPPPDTASERYTMADVDRVLGELDADQRAVFELHYVRGLRYADIATTLGIPANTVASRLYRARRAIRDALLSNQREPA